MAFKIKIDDIISGVSGKNKSGNKPLSSIEILNLPKDNNKNNKTDVLNPSKIKNNHFVKKNLIKSDKKTEKDDNKDIKDETLRNKVKEDKIIEKLKDRESELSKKEEDLKKKSDFNPKQKEPKLGKNILSIGKNLYVFSDTSFNIDGESFLEKKDIFDNKNNFLPDRLRGLSNQYWTIDKNSNSVRFLTNIHENQKSLFEVDYFDEDNDINESDFGRISQYLALKPDEEKFKNAKKDYSKNLKDSFLTGKKFNGSTLYKESLDLHFSPVLIENLIFNDYSFVMSLPFNENELKKYGDFKGASFSDIKTDYNFFIEDYEFGIKNKNISEIILPNIYVLLLENESEKTNPFLNRVITLGDLIQTDSKKILTSEKKSSAYVKNKSRVYSLKDNPLGEYYDLFGRQAKFINKEISDELNKKFSNILFSIKDLQKIQKFNIKQELFPLSVDIRFSVDKTAQISQILKDTDSFDLFTSYISNKIISNNFKTINTNQVAEELLETDGTNNLQKRIKTEQKNIKVLEVGDLFADLKENKEILNKENYIFLGDYENIQKTENKSEFKFFRSLNLEILQTKIQSFIKNNLRSYQDITEGELCYNETVLYRIAKFIGDPVGQPIQNFYFPNDPNLDVMEFIDTQVKYDKKYSYILYSYQFVLGNKYWYSDVKAEEFEKHCLFQTYNEPSPILAEIPIQTFIGRILDKPPSIPEVQINSYFGIDNKVLLSFNSSINEFKAFPVIIQNSDADVVNKIREAHKIQKNEPLLFGGDDRIAFYQIFRLDGLENKPSSYLDFRNGFFKQVSTDISKITQQKATNISWVDTIEANKKYYYIFRAIDIHGHISNPTELYEIEMINEHGTVFLVSNVVDFKPKIEREIVKTGKRFIQIVPTVLQGLIDEKKSGFDLETKSAETIKKQISLGLNKEKIWGKKFRIVLTSKSSGKKVNFDVSFIHNKIEIKKRD